MVDRRRLGAKGAVGRGEEPMAPGDKGTAPSRRGERTGVAGKVAMALSTFTSRLRSIRNGLRSLPLGRTRALMARRSEWTLPSPVLSVCPVPLGRRRADGATRMLALVWSPRYTWPQARSSPGSRSAMAGLWVLSAGAESFLLATAPTLLACAGDMPDNSIDLVSCAMLCCRCVEGEGSIGVLGAVGRNPGVLVLIGLSTVNMLTLADMDCSAMGDSDLDSPPRESRLSTMALSCCLMDTS